LQVVLLRLRQDVRRLVPLVFGCNCTAAKELLGARGRCVWSRQRGARSKSGLLAFHLIWIDGSERTLLFAGDKVGLRLAWTDDTWSCLQLDEFGW